MTCLIGWTDDGDITRAGNTKQIPHFICTTPMHSNCHRAWEIIPEGEKKKQVVNIDVLVISLQAVIGPMTRKKQDSPEGWAKRNKNTNMQDLVKRSCKQNRGIHGANSPAVQREQNLDYGKPSQTSMNCLSVRAEAPKPPGEWWAGYKETHTQCKALLEVESLAFKGAVYSGDASTTFQRLFLKRHRAWCCYM